MFPGPSCDRVFLYYLTTRICRKKQPNEPLLVKHFYQSRVLSTTVSLPHVNESNDTNRSTGCVDLKRFDDDETFVLGS